MVGCVAVAAGAASDELVRFRVAVVVGAVVPGGSNAPRRCCCCCCDFFGGFWVICGGVGLGGVGLGVVARCSVTPRRWLWRLRVWVKLANIGVPPELLNAGSFCISWGGYCNMASWDGYCGAQVLQRGLLVARMLEVCRSPQSMTRR